MTTVPALQGRLTPPFTNSVERQIGGKWFDRLSPMDFGAVGDGIANDAVAVQRAMTAAVATGRVMSLEGRTYRISSAVTATGSIAMTRGSK